MMKIIPIVIYILTCFNTHAQTTLKIIFVGASQNGEKFKVIAFNNNQRYILNLKDHFYDSLVFNTAEINELDPLSINILRKGRFCFFINLY